MCSGVQSCLTLCDPMDIDLQAPLSMELSRQEYCSGLPFASPGNLPDPGIEPKSPTLQADFTVSKVKVALSCQILCDPKHYTVHGIFQARILEWAAFPFSRGSSQPRDQTQISRISSRFFTTEPLRKPWL